MRLSVLALDYDGTIAVDGALDGTVRTALGEAHARGVSVVLVTGRILADLQKVLSDLTIFDAIVVENGAAIFFPDSLRSIALAPPPPEDFLRELRLRGIPFLAGDSVVETDAEQAAAVLAVVRETQLPLVLVFNRGRMMVLPQAVSKATGLREALRALRLSVHNTVAIGDAENDHELLRVSELGAAVEWGSAALKDRADEVVPGKGPSDVGLYLRRLLQTPRIARDRLGRRRVHLGVLEGGKPFSLGIRDRNVLIAGDTQSGKSWVAGVLCEQMVLEHYCLCIIDHEGEYSPLEALPQVVVLTAKSQPPDLDDIERTLRYPDVSLVVDLAAMELEGKRTFIRALLERLNDLRARTGLPHRIVIDEAHYFLDDQAVVRLLDVVLGGYTLVTWRASRLHPDVLGSSEAVLVTRISDPTEARALHRLRGGKTQFQEWCRVLGGLPQECAVLLPGSDESKDQLLRFRVSGRLTPHFRHHQKYLNLRAPAGQSFYFREGTEPGRPIHSLAELASFLEQCPNLEQHLRQRDLSRWIAAVFQDRILANRVKTLEDAWHSGHLPDPHASLIEVIRGSALGVVPFAL